MKNNQNTYESDRYSSMARYSIAILSALIILFPSTKTFIEPPYDLDILLLVAFSSGFFGFLFNCYVIILTDIGRKKIHSDLKITCSAWGSLLTFTALLLVFIYILWNLWIDRTSNPEIISLKINPLEPNINSLIEFTGEAEDQDSDSLKWQWKIIKENKSTESIESDLKTAHWIPKSQGIYREFRRVTT